MGHETIETPRLRLEPWGDAHREMLIELSADPEVVRHVGLGRPWPPGLAEEVGEAQRDHWIEHGFGWRAEVARSSRELIGLSALNFLGEGNAGLAASEYEIGWWLKPSAWGQGFAAEGAGAMLEEAFGRIGAPSVIARIQPSNERSIRLARALGLSRCLSTTGRFGESLEVFRLLASGTRPGCASGDGPFVRRAT